MSSLKPTIYLIKENITEPRKIFRKDVRLNTASKGDVTLFYIKSKPHTPDWVDFLEDQFDIDRRSFKNASSSAIIVIKLEKRMIAIPLGLGVHLIDLAKTEYNFGLKTALNCIPKSNIRQIDTTTPEINSQKTKKQASIGTTPEEMGINKQKDILRGVTGKLVNGHKLGKSMEGKDSLRVSVPVESLEKLRALGETILAYYATDTYKTDYGWIDNIALVRDNSLIEKLTKALAKALKNARFNDMHFVPPVFYETVFDYQGFAFSCSDGTRLSKKDTFEMPDMTDWKSSIGEVRKNICEENMDLYKVVLIGDDNHPNLSWPLQRCLAWELELKGQRYILSEGSWYNVAASFFTEVNDHYKSKLLDRKELPSPSKVKMNESDYNEEIANSSPHMYLFDLGHATSKNKHIGVDKNEVCDVFDVATRTFYHVKMGKASANISHLLRQGAFSGVILKQEETVLKQFIQHLVNYGCAPNIIPLPYQSLNYNIAFVLVLGKRQKKDIPFFSKVSLRDVTYTNLDLLGYKSSISFVGGI